jgi:hypothetical protein
MQALMLRIEYCLSFSVVFLKKSDENQKSIAKVLLFFDVCKKKIKKQHISYILLVYK